MTKEHKLKRTSKRIKKYTIYYRLTKEDYELLQEILESDKEFRYICNLRGEFINIFVQED